MSLSAGHRLGAYEILSPLGAGGMGEVYRARDTRLGREVAIKVLPADRLSDESRRRRFVQEARAASTLNHPNIVTIHEIESADGADFIVMEYVRGQTLEALLRSRMRLAEVLRVASPIADALARAHAAGIVHRDLKPANVVVTPEGVVKVLDFGLAKLMAAQHVSDAQDMSTETSERFLSGPGTIAGTPCYMSPEQATGGKVDARSDVFSFGSVLYEMVTGRRAFAGASTSETLAAVIRDPPKAPSELVPGLRPDLERLILRCLRKEPERRFQYMADVRVELEEFREDTTLAAAPAKMRAHSPRRWAIRLVAALAVLLAAGAALWLLRVRPAGQQQPPSPEIVPLTATRGIEQRPALSPDGTQVAFSWEGERSAEGEAPNWDIWIKMIGSSEVRRLTTDPAVDSFPSWSRDGSQIAFLRFQAGDRLSIPNYTPVGTIHVASPLGGADRKLVGDFPARPSQLAWSPDGRWLVAARARREHETEPESGGLHLIPLQQGEPRAITSPPPPAYDAHPAFSPDGQRLAYATCAYWLLPPCDLEVAEVGADIIPGLRRRPVRETAGIDGLAWSRDGRSIIYGIGRNWVDVARLWRVGIGDELPRERVELSPRGAFAPATVFSRDRLVFEAVTNDWDIYRFERGRPVTAVAASSFTDYAPSFSPDARRIAWEGGRSGNASEVWLADADGSKPIQLTHGPGVRKGTPHFSPDGRRIAFNSRGEDGFSNIWVIDVDGGSLRRLTYGSYHEGFPGWSRDGRFIYYREDRADGRDISRIPASGGAPERVTHHGGLLPRESADGKTLFYTKRDPTSPIFSLALPDGPERQVVDCALGRGMDAGAGGLYYIGCVPDGAEAPVYRFDPGSGRTELLGKLPAELSRVEGIGVSPDGKTVLFSSLLSRTADLMLIENFR